MKKLLKSFMIAVVFCSMFTARHVIAEETVPETPIHEYTGDCKHHYSSSPVGKKYTVYENGQYRWKQKYINICDYCGDYYYFIVDLGAV